MACFSFCRRGGGKYTATGEATILIGSWKKRGRHYELHWLCTEPLWEEDSLHVTNNIYWIGTDFYMSHFVWEVKRWQNIHRLSEFDHVSPGHVLPLSWITEACNKTHTVWLSSSEPEEPLEMSFDVNTYEFTLKKGLKSQSRAGENTERLGDYKRFVLATPPLMKLRICI